MSADQLTGQSAAPGDLWPTLDPGFRTAALALAGTAAPRVFGGLPGSTISWLPARPFVMDAGHYLEFARTTGRLARLVLQACRRRAGTAGELADVLDMDPADLPLLDRAAPLGDDLVIAVRSDAVYQGGVAKYVELNIDGAVGSSPNVDMVTAGFIREYAQAGIGQQLRAADPAIETRFAVLRDWLGPGRRLVIPLFPVGALPGLAEDRDRFMAWFAPWCEIGRRHGLDTVAFPLEDLRLAADGRLLADGAPVDAALRLFLYFLQPRSEGGDAFAEAVLTGRVAMHTPEATSLLMNKRTLGWLWDDLDLLSEPDRQLVTGHVPHTAYLPSGTRPGDRPLREARARQAELVLKPGLGHSGWQVTVGPAVSPQDWDAALGEAAASGGYVLQEYVRPDTTPMEFVHGDTGERCAAEVPYVAGPFLFGGRPAGMLIRHGGPAGGAVINAGTGGLISTALLLDRQD
jgi:hypothetical protein